MDSGTEPAPGVILVRHGRTAWNLERRFLGRTDLSLDGEGARQADRLGAVWSGRVTAVITSPLARARETAARLGAPVVDPRWTEVDHGELEGLTADDAMARHPEFFRSWEEDPGPVRIPGGESLAEARDRAMGALADLRATTGSTLAVVAHQLVLAAVAATLAGEPLRRWRRFALEPTGVRPLYSRDGSWHLTPG